MRFVWAITAFVLATLMIGAGIAQRTILQAPATQTASVTTDDDAPYVLVDGSVFDSRPGAQTLRVDGDAVFAAYARTGDLTQWLAPTDYTHVTMSDAGEPTSELVSATVEQGEG